MAAVVLGTLVLRGAPAIGRSLGHARLPLLAICWALSSTSMHMLNKVCVALTGAASGVTAVQMLITVVTVVVFCWRDLCKVNRAQVLRWSVVPVFYAAMLNTSLLSYRYLTLSLVTVFRNLAPIVTLLVESAVMPPAHRPSISVKAIASLHLALLGALVYSYAALEFNWIGVALVALNSLMAIADRLIQRRLLVGECKDMALPACMAINNTLGIVPTVALCFVLGEPAKLHQRMDELHSPIIHLLVLLSGAMGLSLCYFGLACQREMTATSFQVMQNVSKVLVVAVGVVEFDDQWDSLTAAGMALSLLGGFLYGRVRAQEQAKLVAAAVAVASEDNVDEDVDEAILKPSLYGNAEAVDEDSGNKAV
eukprot:NODE_11205_length_1301_cov_4.799830.p1 GENE.NODE_11205_length_1301_cov_4.799830~~NODE_11205_length_1301_cov_4.799830.p1  ORF type:complete len:415 (+),score=134.09 NODE_11205_length_1301_cov_4.799830:149-1246(+)